MRLKSLYFNNFKRFTELRVKDIPETSRLIVLVGANGCGKSSFFDGLQMWQSKHKHYYSFSDGYHQKIGSTNFDEQNSVQIETHENIDSFQEEDRKKLVYMRGAHRYEADFTLNNITEEAPVLDRIRIARSIDVDVTVLSNYQSLVLSGLEALYGDSFPENATKKDIIDREIGVIRESLAKIFPDLIFKGISPDPLSGGSFIFSKGESSNFFYKNLSAGEKAVFELLLDIVTVGKFYDNTIWCIDEPEIHLNTKVQALLLEILLDLLPKNCQLVLASHSIGFMRKAWEMSQKSPNEVHFLDFQDKDFDTSVTLAPVTPSRSFWKRTLEVTLGDISHLVAPEQIVLCEGRPAGTKGKISRSEFDASCYRKIFAEEFPNVDFISMGNSDEVKNDKIGLGRSLQTVLSNTKVTRLIDRDHMNEDEVEQCRSEGVSVLNRRNIESYLLDDQVIKALAFNYNHEELGETLIEKKKELLEDSKKRDNDIDDIKSIAAQWHVHTRKILSLREAGSNWESFAVKSIAPLLAPGLEVYEELKSSIFVDSI